MRYPCDRCEYAATRAADLKKHKESKHEGIRYTCDQCDYAASNAGNLKRLKFASIEDIYVNSIKLGFAVHSIKLLY